MKVTFNELADAIATRLLKEWPGNTHVKALAANDLTRCLLRLEVGSPRLEKDQQEIEVVKIYHILDDLPIIVWGALEDIRESRESHTVGKP